MHGITQTLKHYGADILGSENFKKSGANIQHGRVSVMQHSISVAKTALKLNRRLRLKCREKDLVRGALLHDYFLYDWHDWKDPRNLHPRLHGFYHPGIALKNAQKEYDLTRTERDIIKKHMWPMTVIPPACKESWVVACVDKYVSLKETLFER